MDFNDAFSLNLFRMMINNTQPRQPGNYDDSDIYVIQAGDFSYVLDVSYEHDRPKVHQWRMSKMLPNQIDLNVIFDFKHGAAFDSAMERIAL